MTQRDGTLLYCRTTRTSRSDRQDTNWGIAGYDSEAETQHMGRGLSDVEPRHHETRVEPTYYQ
ncbi:hypothetical protein [Leptolyngbya sp. CCY15150]|uniref:hypothetical protein n=1 Tax=Leptolyngbya sp. CCY15150 TaxID=2767772 RepID=UPI00194F76E6|nr:hypothetical protein [Leptolyngbya sp. CCY15150]